jgi:hypothetical protein
MCRSRRHPTVNLAVVHERMGWSEWMTGRYVPATGRDAGGCRTPHVSQGESTQKSRRLAGRRDA